MSKRKKKFFYFLFLILFRRWCRAYFTSVNDYVMALHDAVPSPSSGICLRKCTIIQLQKKRRMTFLYGPEIILHYVHLYSRMIKGNLPTLTSVTPKKVLPHPPLLSAFLKSSFYSSYIWLFSCKYFLFLTRELKIEKLP